MAEPPPSLSSVLSTDSDSIKLVIASEVDDDDSGSSTDVTRDADDATVSSDGGEDDEFRGETVSYHFNIFTKIILLKIKLNTVSSIC